MVSAVIHPFSPPPLAHFGGLRSYQPVLMDGFFYEKYEYGSWSNTLSFAKGKINARTDLRSITGVFCNDNLYSMYTVRTLRTIWSSELLDRARGVR